MLLINSISNTKKFFQKTFYNVKSSISKGNISYQRLPKTPQFHPFSHGHQDSDIETGYKDLDNFYSEFTHRWDSQKGNPKIKPEKKSVHKPTKQVQKFPKTPATTVTEEQKVITLAKEINNTEKVDMVSKKQIDEYKIKISNTCKYELIKQTGELCSRSVRERRLSSMVEKLKELESMDEGNGDHKFDVDEILDYYSKLTCPEFLDIVDKFFSEICTEFYSSQQVST